MGNRRLDRQDSDTEFQRDFPSCMWSMFHILDWHGVKWISPRRRHRRRKHAIFGCGYQKTLSFENYKDEVQNDREADDVVPLLDERRSAEAIPGEKNSGKVRIKALIAKEHSARSQLQRAISVRNSHDLDGKTADWSNPIIILERNSDTAASRLHDKPVGSSLDHSFSDSKLLGRDISQRQLMECADVMEIFKINKKLFVEILHNPDAQVAENFHGHSTYDKTARLKKSESFPLAESPRKFLRPVTLENKWKDSWFFPKGAKFPGRIEETKVSTSKPEESNPDDHPGKVVSTTQESELSSSELPKHGWHQSFLRHLKDVMKRIKHTRKRRRNESNRASTKALPSKVPSNSIDKKDNPERLKEGKIQQDDNPEVNSSDNDLRNMQPPHMRRVSSLNEFMDRYSRLFENSSTMESWRHKYHSKSLSLTNESKFSGTGSSLKSFRRRLSLPDLDSICPLPDENSLSAIPSMMTIKSNTNSDINDLKWVQIKSFGTVEETKHQENAKNENSDDLMASMEGETANPQESEKDTVDPQEQKHSYFQPDITCQTEFSVPEDLESTSSCKAEPDFPANREEICDKNSWKVADCQNDENMRPKVENNFLPFESNESDDADFNYVRDVLELSGLIEQGHLGTWHSIDQPLTPTLFKELEAYLHQESRSSSELVDCGCDHQLLFDLINQVLLQIFESSLAYFPEPFSFTRQVRPLPTGNRVLQEVWKRISRYRNSGLKTDQSLDDIIASDLEKDDRLMNLQMDAEDIALDLEDLIFDELLEEAICLSGCQDKV